MMFILVLNANIVRMNNMIIFLIQIMIDQLFSFAISIKKRQISILN